MKKIFLALFLLVFCAYSQNDSDKNQSAEISRSIKAPSIKKAKKACENKEKLACMAAVSMMLGKANSSADELKEVYKLTQNLWLSQNLVREKSLKTYELRQAPDGAAGGFDIINFLAGTQEKLVCDELPLILALARKNATEPLQERIYGISGGELMELFRTYKVSSKIAEIFTK
nr:hypothetical protein [uncultured Campylobacter sp.]